jgi:hypothetical protein
LVYWQGRFSHVDIPQRRRGGDNLITNKNESTNDVLGHESRSHLDRRDNRLSCFRYAADLGIRYDRHKTELDEHYRFLHLMAALLIAIDYISSCLINILEPLETFANKGGIVPLIPNRLNTDFLQTARLQLATISSSSDIFPGVTRAFRDVEHCNGMLHRYENECRKLLLTDTPSFPAPDQLRQSGLLNSTQAALKNAVKSLSDSRIKIDETIKSISECKPQLLSSRKPS